MLANKPRWKKKDQPDSSKYQQSPKRGRQTPPRSTTRINLTISTALLERLDKAAEQDYTSRSDIIRLALLWYLRPQGRDLDQADPEVIVKTLQRRKVLAELRKEFPTINDYDFND